jgi:hypothetical protein
MGKYCCPVASSGTWGGLIIMQKVIHVYIQITSDVIHGTLAWWLMWSVKMNVIIFVIYIKTVILWH